MTSVMNAITSLKALARDACGQALSLIGATAPAVRLRQRLSIITFHRVLTESQRALYPLPGLAVTPEELDAHLKFVRRHFRCLSLASALDLLADDRYTGPPLLAVTFDDGQLDNYENALPVLEQNGVTASFYVPSQVLRDPTPLWPDVLATSILLLDATSGDLQARALIAELHTDQDRDRSAGPMSIEAAVESTKAWSAAQRQEWIRRAQTLVPHPVRPAWDGFMSVDQLKSLIDGGHEIGSHSHSHPLLPQCTDEELVSEILGSKHALESALGTPVTTFCYPNGSIDARTVDCVRRAGYRAAVTTEWGGNSRAQDPFQLKRFDMYGKHAQDRTGRFSEARLAWRMSGLYPGLPSASPYLYLGAQAR
jgi:peptidoglycan/xylan/chitin deacetylase (PgdA/CDA1 family)